MKTDEEDAAKISAPGKALAIEFWSAAKAARSAVSERGFAWTKIDALISRFEEKWRVRLAEVSDLALEITFTNQELRKRLAMAEGAADKGEKGRALGTAMEEAMAELEAINNASATPRTDEAEANTMPNLHMVKAEFARGLERDLAAVEKERDVHSEELVSIQNRIRKALDDEAIEGSSPSECVEILVSQRDNAFSAAESYRKDLAEARERLAKSEKENRVQFDAWARTEREVIELREHAKRVEKLASEDSMAEQRKRLVAESELEKGSKAAERMLKAKSLARMVCDTLEEGQSEVLTQVCLCGGDLEFAPYEISEPHSFRSFCGITRNDSRLRCKKCGASFTVAP